MNRLGVPAALLLTALLSGCGVELEEQPRSLPAAEITPGNGTSAGDRTVAVYLVNAEGLLERVEASGETGAYTSSALQTLLDIGSNISAPDGYTNAIPPGTELEQVVVYPEVIRLHLSDEFRTLRGAEQVLAAAQLVVTATERRRDATVELYVDGEAVPLPADEGALEDDGLTRAEYTDLLDPES